MTKCLLQIFLFLSIIGVFAGCVSIKNATAGEIGCNPDDIMIGDKRTLTLVDYWHASCHGKHYECSGSGNVFSAYQAKCKESHQR